MNISRHIRLATVTALALVLLSAVPGAAQQTDPGEQIIRFVVADRAELSLLTDIVYIDRVFGDTVIAYVTDAQLEAFLRLGYEYELLPHPVSGRSIRMSSRAADAAAWDSYPSYDAYVQMMFDFETSYPDLCDVFSIGQSVQGRELLIARLSANVATETAEPEVLYTSSMHGDELTGYILMLRLIDSLLTTYGSDPTVTAMLDSMEIWINPLANPDGAYYGGNSTVSFARRTNANGYDLNRNFPDPEDGPAPGGTRQVETQAFIDLAEAESFDLSANFHGGVEVISYPWDTWFRRHPDNRWYIDVAREYADTAQEYSFYSYMTAFNDGITHGYDWYEVNGGRQDMMIYWYGCRELTAEISNDGVPLGSQLPFLWDFNHRSLFRYIQLVQFGIRGQVTDSVTGQPLSATIRVIGHDRDGTVVHTDPDHGDYYRMIEAGTYDLEVSSFGYFTKLVSSITVVPEGRVQVDVALAPLPGRPVLTVHSHDAHPLMPGAVKDFRIRLRNIGVGQATGVAAVIESTDPYLVIEQASSSFGNIHAGGVPILSASALRISVLPSAPMGHKAPLTVIATSDASVDTTTIELVLGVSGSDFESAVLTDYDWQLLGDGAWNIDHEDSSGGRYSARSGYIGFADYCDLKIELDDLTAGSISFDYRTSTDGPGDRLYFFIDGAPVFDASGEIDWTTASFPVTAGDHIFTWRYQKNSSGVAGEDVVWVDNISFPAPDVDSDGDGVAQAIDNCRDIANADQADSDGDGVGDLCDVVCGDFNGSGMTDPVDLSSLVDYLFQGGAPPVDPASCDFDGSGEVGPVDLSTFVDYLFGVGSISCD